MPVSSDIGTISTGRSAGNRDVNVDCVYSPYMYHVYIRMWFVVNKFGEGEGVGAKLNRLRLETDYELTIWSVTWPAMQWHAYKRFFAFLSGNLAPLLLRLRYILNVFKFLSFVKSLSMLIDSLLTTIIFLETKSLPSKPTKSYESEPDLPKPKMLLPNVGRSNRHCLSIEKIPNQERRGNLTMSSCLAC